MEAVSGASSIIAVVSLAIQLAESAKKLYDFWRSVDEAPGSIQRIVADLKLLSTVLAEIAQHEQKYGHDGSFADVLSSCTEQIRIMVTMTTPLQHGLQSTTFSKRKWSAVKAVFKEDKIAKFQSRLMDAKTTLILVRQTLSDKSIHTYFNHNGQMLAAMTQDMEALREQNTQTTQILGTQGTTETLLPNESLKEITSRAASNVANQYLRLGFEKAIETAIKKAEEEFDRCQEIQSLSQNQIYVAAQSTPKPRHLSLLSWQEPWTSNCFFGEIRVESITIQNLNDKEDRPFSEAKKREKRLWMTFRPATWLMRFGLAYELRLALEQSSHGWKGYFQTYRPVPDDSMIFEFCRSGNIEGVQLLFSRKEASVWDVDSKGWTLLQVAAYEHQIQIAKLLLAEGADPELPCLMLAIEGIGCCRMDTYNAWLDSVSLFAHQFEYDIADLLGSQYLEKPRHEPELDLIDDELEDLCIKDLVQTLGFHLRTSEVAKIIFWAVCLADNSLSTITWAANDYGNTFNTRLSADSYSPFLSLAASGNWDAVDILARHGADLHCFGFSEGHSPAWESPTSLATYNSRNFFKWRQTLRDLEIDMEDFIEKELKGGRLHKDGWTAQTLQILFDLDFGYVDRHEDCKDCECGYRELASLDDGLDEDEDEDRDDDHHEADEVDIVDRIDAFDNDEEDGRCGTEEGVMVEVKWQNLLARIKRGEDFEVYLDHYFKDSGSKSQEGWDRNRDIVELSEGEDSESGEENQQPTVAVEEKIEDDNRDADDDDDWEDVSEEDESEVTEEEEVEFDSPEWYCIECWYKLNRPDNLSPPASEVDSDEEDSPMLLKIGV